MRRFSSQEYKLNLDDFLVSKTSKNQLILYPRKWAEISWFSSKEKQLKYDNFLAYKRAEIRFFSSPEYELESADFLAY